MNSAAVPPKPVRTVSPSPVVMDPDVHRDAHASASEHSPTIAGTLSAGSRKLDGRELQLPARRLCELLLADLLQCRPIDLIMQSGRELDPGTVSDFFSSVDRLANGEPLQYIIGTTYFMERLFLTDARALIPRPETESLIQAVLACDDLRCADVRPRILDAGTGSGCLAVTLALELPTAVCLACDISAQALDLAMENAQRHGVLNRISFFNGDGLATGDDQALDAIVSNPPYIATADYLQLPAYIRRFEPRGALDGGPDGLSVIKSFILQAVDRLRPGGWIFLEIGHGQWDAVRQCLLQGGYLNPELRHDIAGHERVAYAQMP